MKQLRMYTIKQLSPGMLQNPKSEELLMSLRTKKRLPVRTDWSIEEESGTKLYRSEDGYMGVPTQNIIGMLLLAGQHLTYKGKKTVSTAKSTILFDFLEFRTDFCKFKDCVEQKDKDGKPTSKFDIPWSPFMAGGVMHQGSSETAVCITRPRIHHWSLTIPVIFDCDREINDKTVDALIDIAGRKIGLCDWRPNKKGRFGRFVTELIEVLPIEEKKEEVKRSLYDVNTAPAEMLELAGL